MFEASDYRRISPFELERALMEHEAVAKLPETILGKMRHVQLRAQEVAQRASGTRAAGEFFEEDFAS